MMCRFFLLFVFVVFGQNWLSAKETHASRTQKNVDDHIVTNYYATNRDDSYNFYEYLFVILQLEIGQKVNLNQFILKNPNNFCGFYQKDYTLRLTQKTILTSNQTLNVYDQMGNLIKTINTNNSIYSNLDTFAWTKGFYDIVLPQFSTKPLKFVIAH